MSYIAHQFFIWSVWYLSFRIYFFIAPTRSQETIINFGTFVTGVKPTSWWLLRPWYIDQITARVSPRLFLESISPKDFRNSFVSLVGQRKSELTYLDPPKIKRVLPCGEKSDFFSNFFILIAQKERLGALNLMRKTTGLCKVPLLRK